MVLTAYLPAVEEALLEQLTARSGLTRNRILRLALRSLYVFAADQGFDNLDAKLALAAREAAAAGS